MQQDMNESHFIKNHLLKLTNGNQSALGLEDDVAQIGDYIINTDTTIEGIHILQGLPVNFIAYKAMARSFSDIAAKGGVAIDGGVIGYFLNIILPKKFDKFAELMQGFEDFANQCKLDFGNNFKPDLLGGDTSTYNGASIIIISTIVAKSRNHPVRSGAKIGDGIYLTKKIGEAFLGYELLKNGAEIDLGNLYIKEYLSPTLVKIEDISMLNSCMDISDGLLHDANKIAQTSKCVLVIDFNLLPASQKITKEMLIFGDDYNILMTSPHDIPNTTKIGEVKNGSESFGVKLINCPFDLGIVMGFDHFTI